MDPEIIKRWRTTRESLIGQHELHCADNGHWMYRSLPNNGRWTTFHDDAHFFNTVHAATGYEVSFFKLDSERQLPDFED